MVALLPIEINKAAGNAQRYHGTGGLFGNTAGMERQVVSSVERPINGLSAVVPAIPVNTEKTEFSAITGFATSGSEAAEPCDSGPTGTFTACKLRVTMGHKIASSKIMQPDGDMNRLDIADTDLELIGTLMGMGNLVPEMSYEQLFQIMAQSEMVKIGMQFETHVTNTFWQGDTANNNVGGGYKEAMGLDNQITTGITNVETEAACPDMDSTIVNFDFSAPDESGGASGDFSGLSLYEALRAGVERPLYFKRLRARANVETAIVMRPEMWEWVSEALPCQIESASCSSSSELGDGKTLFIDAGRNRAATDQMRNTNTLRLNGRTYAVVIDDGLPIFNNTTNPADLAVGEEASHIAFVPLVLNGRYALTYNQHKNYRRAAEQLQNLPIRMWTDNGRYWWNFVDTGFCVTVSGKLEYRPVLRSPQWAGKLEYVRYA